MPRSIPSILQQVYISLSKSSYDFTFVAILLLAEATLCRFIITRVAYTEIDWEAYMQEVDTYQAGERDYLKIRGGTGPLVYPAGFLYLYAWLKQRTNDGTDIFTAQVYFSYLYVAMMAVILELYTMVARQLTTTAKSNLTRFQQAHLIWSWRIAMGVCCLSKRLHSIYVLRLFNDGPAMVLCYISILFFCRHQWRLGCVFYSLAVSIKMNILLFAPGLFLLLLQASPNVIECILCLGICAVLQLLLGAPFLIAHPISYLRKAFELDRVFFYKWTVNWKFLPEDIFVSKPIAIGLLVLHLSTLAYLAVRWIQAAQAQTGRRLFVVRPQQDPRRLAPDYIIYTLFLSNVVGICFARTLHYQFYSWYCSTVPFLLWRSAVFPGVLRLILIAAMEYAFLVFPATPTSSAILQIAHLLTLLSSIVTSTPKGLPGNLQILHDPTTSGSARQVKSKTRTE